MDPGTAKFSIPYIDFPMRIWEDLADQFAGRIREVYYPVDHRLIGSGRPVQPSEKLREFLESGLLPTAMLLNPVVLPGQLDQLAPRLLETIHEHHDRYTLCGLTLASPGLARRVRDHFPDLELTASTLMDIHHEEQLLWIGDVFDTIVPSSRILRNIAGLKNLRAAFKGGIKLIVNESCLPGCLDRTQHFYEMSNPGIAFPHSLCHRVLEEKPWLSLTGNWILPQHLGFIDGLYDDLKLAGRVSLADPERYREVLSGYIDRAHMLPHEIGGGPGAVQQAIQIEDEFYEYTLHCARTCTSCTHCEEYYDMNT